MRIEIVDFLATDSQSLQAPEIFNAFEQRATFLLGKKATQLQGASVVLNREIGETQSDRHVHEIFALGDLSGAERFGLFLLQRAIEEVALLTEST